MKRAMARLQGLGMPARRTTARLRAGRRKAAAGAGGMDDSRPYSFADQRLAAQHAITR